MNYEVLDEKYTINYLNAYIEAKRKGEEIKCFIGEDKLYRMTSRNSIITTLTDPNVLLEYCIYPLFTKGDIEIGKRSKDILLEMASSENVIYIYQAVKFVYSQDKLIKKYNKLPIIIDVCEIAPILLEKINVMQKEMKEYKSGEFALYSKSIYDMMQGMIRKSKSFNQVS